MCGIFACLGVVDAGKKIFTGLKNLEYRGYDSWGLALPAPTGFQVQKNIGFLPPISPSFPSASWGIGHTRWATHGGVTVANAHPQLDCSGRLALVHNGVVENWRFLRRSLPNHSFHSQTDTEILVHALESLLASGHSLPQAVSLLVPRLKGYNAFVVGDSASSTLVAYRSGSPLTLAKFGKSYFISSDLPTLRTLSKILYPLRDGELAVFGPSSTRLSRSGRDMNIPWTEFPPLPKTSQQIATRYHLESEIFESLSRFELVRRSLAPALSRLRRQLRSHSRLLLTGCGSAFYACLLGQKVLTQQGFLASAAIASEGAAFLPTVDSKTLVIAVSQSGETIDTLDFVRACQARGATLAAVLNVPGSTLDRLATLSLPLNAGLETAVASSKAFFFMVLTFLALFPPPVRAWHSLVSHLDRLLASPSRANLQKLARRLATRKHLFVLGKGFLYPLACELALKCKEIGYLHAEAFPAGELKHGPLALITSDSLCLTLEDSATESALATARSELEARGGEVIKLAAPALGTLTPLYLTVLVHLLSFELALAKGINPDRPRNLAKSVTVK